LNDIIPNVITTILTRHIWSWNKRKFSWPSFEGQFGWKVYNDIHVVVA